MLLFAARWSSGCATALGPGYTITQQEIEVQFSPSPEPLIRVNALYRLRNTGNQPLSSIELRLPGRRRFHYVDPTASWDSASLVYQASPDTPRNTLFVLPHPWAVSSSHTLKLSVEFLRPEAERSALSFSPDAFFLPAQGWSPELLPAHGIFATGGVPPQSWNLTVRVPRDFLVHASGRPAHHSSRKSRGSEEQVLVSVQRTDPYPFIVAGRYQAMSIEASDATMTLWTRSREDPEAFRNPTAALVRAIEAYNLTFGSRLRAARELFIVECPALPGCFSATASSYAGLVLEPNQEPSAELASLDTVMVDLRPGPAVVAAAAAPSLAASWLGYDQNPGFFEQQPPLSALPAFAAARGREAVEGPQVRQEIIRRLLRAIPERSAARQPETDNVLRAKNLLFFYALQDQYGRDTFKNALTHMLSARRGGGFDLGDLIAAFEEESHQNVAEFVRLWMKHPGVPDEFRARYENVAGAPALMFKETP